MQLDVAGMEVSYCESGLLTNAISKLQLGPSCFTMPKRGRPHVPWRDALMAYTHYTRLLRKALDVSWQQHMTNQELYGKIPSAMHQLRERRLTFAGHCYRYDDQPVKHLVLWEGRAGRMLRRQANRLTYVKQLLRDLCCETVDECMLNRLVI